MLRAREARDERAEVRAWKAWLLADRMLMQHAVRRRGGRRGQGHASLTGELTERLRVARRGEWSSLLTTGRAGPGERIPRSCIEALKADVQEIEACLDDHDEQRAIQRVKGRCKLASPAVVRAALPALFPKAQQQRVERQGPEEAIEEDATAVREAIRHIICHPKRRRGAGPSGGRLEHWCVVEADPETMESTLDVLMVLALGRAPAEVMDAMAGAMVGPFQKPGGGVRPSAAGAAPRRIIAKAVARVFRTRAKLAVGPRRYACK